MLSPIILENYKVKSDTELYHMCRNLIPEVHSDVLQKFIQQKYMSTHMTYIKDCSKKAKNVMVKVVDRRPTVAVKPSLLWMSVAYLQKSEKTKITSYWLKFARRCFPLFGKNQLERIEQQFKLEDLQFFEIFKDYRGKLKCNLVFRSLPINKAPIVSSQDCLAIDYNSKHLVCSDNTFISLKKLAHIKREYQKKRVIS